MKHTHTVIIVVLVAIVTFLATSALMPRQAIAPSSSVESPPGSTIIPMNIVSIEDHASTSPVIEISYPQFPSLSQNFNAEIASATMSRLDDFRNDVTDNETARSATSGKYPNAVLPMNAYTFQAGWEPAQINSRFISFIERYDSFSGGANGNQQLHTFNYDIASQKPLTLDDLFGSSPNYLQKISELAREQLTGSLSAAGDGHVMTDMIYAGTEPAMENFSNFTFTDNTVTIYFPKYAVAPGAAGEQKVMISRDSVK